MAQPTIARIERGANVPRVDTLDRLLAACGEGLYARPRRGVGIDRSLINWWRAIPPQGRLRVAEDRPDYRPGGGAGDWRPEAALAHLLDHDVAFVVIGGLAAQLLGSPAVTFDTDVCYARDPENLERLARALEACRATLRGAPESAPTPIDLQRLRLGMNFTLKTDFGPLDCLGEVGGVGGFHDLMRIAVRKRVGQAEVWVAGLSDLIRMKEAAGRRKDRIMLEDLFALQEELDRSPPDD